MQISIPNTTLFALLFHLFLATSARAQETHKPFEIKHLTGNFYVYTTYQTLESGPYPANAMYVITPQGALLIDTPWDSTQIQPLIDSIWQRHHCRVAMSISTHFHSDRTRGLDYFQQKGVQTWSSQKTWEACVAQHEEQAKFRFQQDTTFSLGGLRVETFYPGPGHTFDNIVVWFPEAHVLYGGCFVKSIEVHDLGYTADGDVHQWPVSVKKVLKKYPDAQFVIPGHYGWSGKNALKHTLKLLRKHAKN